MAKKCRGDWFSAASELQFFGYLSFLQLVTVVTILREQSGEVAQVYVAITFGRIDVAVVVAGTIGNTIVTEQLREIGQVNQAIATAVDVGLAVIAGVAGIRAAGFANVGGSIAYCCRRSWSRLRPTGHRPQCTAPQSGW